MDKPLLYKNGKRVRHDYIVTIRRDHYINVSAPDPEEAERRALKEVTSRWGRGTNLEVVEVEKI